MMIRIYNAKIMTPTEIVDGGEMWIKDGKITFISQCSPLILLPWDREINANGNLLAPSFKNGHAHSPMVFLRSYADDLPLQSWLSDKVFPNEAKLNADDCYWLTKLAITEYLSSGISAVADMYFHLNAMADACAESGFRNVIMEGITQGNASGLLKRLEDGEKSMQGLGGVVEYRIGLHGEYTNDESNIKAMAEYAKAKKQPIYTHLSETKKEVDECIQRHGKTPPAYLAELGVFDFGGCAYHAVHVTADDIKILAERNVSVISCPASNLKLASGIAPLVQMQKAGINLGLGTDGAASNNCLDMFREMFLACGLQKYLLNDASVMSAKSVFDMATCGSAKAMGLDNLNGLEVGQNADMMMINLQQPNMQPLNNIRDNLVYSGSKFNVMMTIVAGKILYENGEYFVGEDINNIFSKCSAICERIKNK